MWSAAHVRFLMRIKSCSYESVFSLTRLLVVDALIFDGFCERIPTNVLRGFCLSNQHLAYLT